MPASETYDAVIAGGGPAGSAAAITLARAGARVLLVEALDSVPFKIGESLPPAAHPLLRDLGVAERLATGAHRPCPGNVAAWGRVIAEHDFIRDLHGTGWHLDRPRFDATLRDAAREAGTTLRTSCLLTRWKYIPSQCHWEAALFAKNTTTAITARWLLDATGRRALIATSQGAIAHRDDRLIAHCAVLPAAPGDTDARTFIESAEHGWWYSALLPAGQRLHAFFTDEDLPAARAASDPETFHHLLATTHQGHTASCGPRAERIRRFPAGSVSRTAFGGDGWLALGDASLAFDPLSSQGIFHALYTGLRGAQTALTALGGDRGALPAWHQRLRSIHYTYQQHLAQCYTAETRWPDSPFWQRRQHHSATAHAA